MTKHLHASPLALLFFRIGIGFKKAPRDNVEVTVSGAVRADISMQLGEVAPTLEVQATAALLQKRQPESGRQHPGRRGTTGECPQHYFRRSINDRQSVSAS